MREHCSRLVQSLSLVALDRESAADAAQEAFLELHLHLGEVRDPVPWLYRVAFNRCMDSRRRFARRVRMFERLKGSMRPDDWVAPAMDQSEFKEVLAGLPLRQRAAATLYYLADLPHIGNRRCHGRLGRFGQSSFEPSQRGATYYVGGNVMDGDRFDEKARQAFSLAAPPVDF